MEGSIKKADLEVAQDTLAKGRWSDAKRGKPPGSTASDQMLIRCIDVKQSKGGPSLRWLATLGINDDSRKVWNVLL